MRGKKVRKNLLKRMNCTVYIQKEVCFHIWVKDESLWRTHSEVCTEVQFNGGLSVFYTISKYSSGILKIYE